jgi:hypothetical protein
MSIPEIVDKKLEYLRAILAFGDLSRFHLSL